ncbi:MAG: [LysW]-lysine hydrolase [Chloroflexota bacterium]|nr:[LysW]-lysine hydrolase [Chloroflexota bacterium]
MNPAELLSRMVAIPSLSGEEQELANFLVGAMWELGFSAWVDAEGNAIGVRESGDDICREIVLLGHMDTVPGEIPVRVEGDRLYGRGTVDAKGPLATFIAAASQAALGPGTRVVVVGAVEEEAATSRGARHVAAWYRPDACIIGEPSGWDGVTLGYKGRLLVDYCLSQPMGHTAGPEDAVAERAVGWWRAVRRHAERFNEGRERLFERLLPSLRDICTSSDGLHDQVEMKVGLRLPPDFDAQALESALREEAGEATLHFYAYEPAFQASRATWLVRAFQRAIRQHGTRPRFKVKTGTSDMNVVGPAWHCPIVAYGPGDSCLDHTPEEHVEIAEYLKAIEIVKTVLETWSGEWRDEG